MRVRVRLLALTLPLAPPAGVKHRRRRIWSLSPHNRDRLQQATRLSLRFVLLLHPMSRAQTPPPPHTAAGGRHSLRHRHRERNKRTETQAPTTHSKHNMRSHLCLDLSHRHRERNKRTGTQATTTQTTHRKHNMRSLLCLGLRQRGPHCTEQQQTTTMGLCLLLAAPTVALPLSNPITHTPPAQPVTATTTHTLRCLKGNRKTLIGVQVVARSRERCQEEA